MNHTITFFYKVLGHPKLYNGKYVTNSLPLFHSGLDFVVILRLLIGVNEYRLKDSMYCLERKDLSVGIVSAYNQNSLYHSSSEEIKHFDFYCIEKDGKIANRKIYMYGNLVK